MKKHYPQSRIVKRSYPSHDPEQADALAKDETLRSYKSLREQKSGDRYRPSYHFVNPENTMNDPNGLCYWRGRWHLFYQSRPIEDERLHWGHAYSDDLIHWHDLPNAIFPGPENDCYSGTIMIEHDRAVAMYHGTRIGNMVAIAEDERLVNWSKLGDHAVIPFSEGHDKKAYGIFDPCIWSEDGMYYSISAGIRLGAVEGAHRATNFLFRSEDLMNWEYVHEFIEGDIFTIDGDDGACPYFLPFGDKHILIFFSHMTGAQYFIGDFDKERMKFKPTAHGKFNFGATFPCGVHAPAAFPLSDGDIALIFNMNNGLPQYSFDNFLRNFYGHNRVEQISKDWDVESKKLAWDQIMTLPRRLSLLPDDNVAQSPISAVESCRGKEQKYEDIVLTPNNFVELEGVAGDTVELLLKVSLVNCQSFTVRVLSNPDGNEFTDINIYRNRGKIYRTPDKKNVFAHKIMSTAISKTVRWKSVISVDTTSSSIDPNFAPRPPEVSEYEMDDNGVSTIRIFIDRSVVEVFADKQAALSVRAFPSLNSSTRIQFLSRGSESRILELSCWQMHSIYEAESDHNN
ncbi:glycoside hydrolase family 32 protein [Candidatus Puniceispirillum marinum]|jgi:beta-fructofuranosidase|uniref:beta-fructofuranosidase n=1 Tax=Puniceispirillum marinum (strain IMCC1322) TaxID=488538 RepID=D5BU04_PUNMI|nr:glycoside hydrolase family 32 protein [Candidatus Puniceispirillum marinum]ADE39751.1 sucrose-6-phosphate hydrolase [Candidatus Puniceispirillum marinum IMCC1322]